MPTKLVLNLDIIIRHLDLTVHRKNNNKRYLNIHIISR